MNVVSTHSYTLQAGYFRCRILGIVNSVVLKQELVDAHMELADDFIGKELRGLH